MTSATGQSNLGFKLSVGVPLLAAAAGAWYLSAVLVQGSSSMTMGASMSVLPIATMASMFNSPNVAVVSSFLLIWIVGMVAMMFPAMVPVISTYARLGSNQSGKLGGRVTVPSIIFLAGYLSLYALLGVGLFGAVYAVFQLGALLPWLSEFSLIGVAAILFLAGVWQLSPLKEKVLGRCISPMGFFLTHSKKGPVGALRMGAEHGAYCVGCCWLYMLVMLAVAAMSLFSMVILSGLIIVEKVFVGGKRWFKWVSAGAFFLLAVLVLVFPASLAIGL